MLQRTQSDPSLYSLLFHQRNQLLPFGILRSQMVRQSYMTQLCLLLLPLLELNDPLLCAFEIPFKPLVSLDV